MSINNKFVLMGGSSYYPHPANDFMGVLSLPDCLDAIKKDCFIEKDYGIAGPRDYYLMISEGDGSVFALHGYYCYAEDLKAKNEIQIIDVSTAEAPNYLVSLSGIIGTTIE